MDHENLPNNGGGQNGVSIDYVSHLPLHHLQLGRGK